MSEQPATYNTGAEFKREDRYFVFKRSDVPQSSIETLESMRATQDVLRQIRGKPPLVCVVVEKDWPEYETVWAMIKARVTKKVTKFTGRRSIWNWRRGK
jgi:hypothetical protein